MHDVAKPLTQTEMKSRRGTMWKAIAGLVVLVILLVGIKAMEQWIKANGGKKPNRTDVVTAVRKIKNFKGVTGSIEFDNKGDPVKAKYFVLQFEKQAYPGKVVKVNEQQAPPAAKKS